MKLRAFAILAAALSLAGCTLPNSTTTTIQTPGGLNGNWQLVVGGFPVGVVFTTTNGRLRPRHHAGRCPCVLHGRRSLRIS